MDFCSEDIESWPQLTVEAAEQWLQPRSEFVPLPTIDDRSRWEALRASERLSQYWDGLFAKAEQAMEEPAPAIPFHLETECDRTRVHGGGWGRLAGQRTQNIATLTLALLASEEERYWEGLEEALWQITGQFRLRSVGAQHRENSLDLALGQRPSGHPT